MKTKKILSCALVLTMMFTMFLSTQASAAVSTPADAATLAAAVGSTKSVANGNLTVGSITIDNVTATNASVESVTSPATGIKVSGAFENKDMNIKTISTDTTSNLVPESRYFEGRYDFYLNGITVNSTNLQAALALYLGLGNSSWGRWWAKDITFANAQLVDGETVITIAGTDIVISQNMWYTVIVVYDKVTMTPNVFIKEKSQNDSSMIKVEGDFALTTGAAYDNLNGKDHIITGISPRRKAAITAGDIIFDEFSVTPLYKFISAEENSIGSEMKNTVYVKPGFSYAFYKTDGETGNFTDNSTGVYTITGPVAASLGNKELKIAAQYSYIDKNGNADSFVCTNAADMEILDEGSYTTLAEAPFDSLKTDSSGLIWGDTYISDLALKFSASLTTRADGTNAMQIAHKNTSNYTNLYFKNQPFLITDGQYAQFELDVLPNSKDITLRLDVDAVTKSGDTFTESTEKVKMGSLGAVTGHIFGVEITDDMVGKWNKVKVTFDTSGAQAKIYMNGVYKKDVSLSGVLAIYNLHIYTKASSDATASENSPEMLGLDNFKLSSTLSIMTGIADEGYNNGASFVSSDVIPSTASAVVLKLNDKLVDNAENEALITAVDGNGTTISGTADITNDADGATVTFTPATTLPRNSEVKLTIPATAKLLRNYAKRVDKIDGSYQAVAAQDYEYEIGTSVEASYKVGDSTGLYIGKTSLNGTSGTTKVMVEIEAASGLSEAAGNVFVAGYEEDGGKLTFIKKIPIPYSAGASYIIKDIPVAQSTTAIKSFTLYNNLVPIYEVTPAQ